MRGAGSEEEGRCESEERYGEHGLGGSKGWDDMEESDEEMKGCWRMVGVGETKRGDLRKGREGLDEPTKRCQARPLKRRESGLPSYKFFRLVTVLGDAKKTGDPRRRLSFWHQTQDVHLSVRRATTRRRDRSFLSLSHTSNERNIPIHV